MAKKRRPKPRSCAPQPPPHSKSIHNSSEDDSNPGRSRGQSSDDVWSERAITTSPHTSFTSMAETNQDASPLVDEDEEDDAHDNDGRYMALEDDAASLYPVSTYPRASSHHKTEIPYLNVHEHEAYDMAASTRSLWEQDLDYREIHGRRYCREYFMPNDEIEQMRMTLIHQVFLHVLEGELTSVPLDNPARVLDVGTGTGEWAIRVAELYPRCEVVGTDISAIAETHSVPMNVFFEVEDAEDWDRLPDHYDFIHLRGMEGAFKNWPAVYENVQYSLKRGGWIEVLDLDIGDNIPLYKEHSPNMFTVLSELHRAAALIGHQQGSSHLDPRCLIESGFTDVRTIDYVIPITVGEETTGKIWLISCLDAFEAYCLRLLTEKLGWDPDECKAACEGAARELANMAKDPETRKDLSVKLRILSGRKPLDSPTAVDLQCEVTPSDHQGDEVCSPSPGPLETGGVRASALRGDSESPTTTEVVSSQTVTAVGQSES